VIEPAEPVGPGSPPDKARAARGRTITPGVLVACVLVAALVSGGVAAGVTLGVIHLQSRTNPQNVSLGSNVTITEDDATTAVARNAQPAVVSIVTDAGTMSHGSGFLVTTDGYIVTNVGVVANAQTLAVLIGTDGKRHDARLVDYDCTTGVAVLKVDQVSNLPTLALDSSGSLRAGQTVIVVPGGVSDRHGVARGVIGALHAMVPVTVGWGPGEIQMSNVIETDTPVDAGASGAPLLNVGGQVIGLTMAAVSQSQPVSFALPASDLQPEIEQIVQGSTLVVPSLGAGTVDVSADTAAIRGGAAGARIATVEAAGSADRAGLRPGDVITQVDDQRLDDAHPLAQTLRTRFRPDQRVTVTYSRGAATGQVQLTLLGDHPACR
jgi:putative serine protease PepD